MVLLLYLLRSRIGGLDGWRLLFAVSRHLLAAGAMAAVLWGWLVWFPPTANTMPLWLTTLVALPLAAAVYAIASLLLRSEELQPALALFRRRLR
jgi:putative peptidoglycan lipid II flippase